jgi:hypothetical protein
VLDVMMTKREEEKDFPLPSTGNLFLFRLCISKKGNSKGNEDLKLIKQSQPSRVERLTK